ncbi:manganese-dependent inorganic pyrophosphatase [Virgibacillus sp. 179-BFC.A HS]|uniref:Probable manganese-dependent inorganic pyrophosphatase n=1 Tax=Tigheibacillus jepli TaxID=3035914 RepID=A0ABU5CJB0_9BACI|nr:manganese-dependent inorganic pyrophosphatase [Virgibacillus sp. 179-BFC.A HS]MDY0406428.1 manganese-dependent inorganic pyrophosphatase [Virgibacillus sp. 179-BFC.A HS]
MAKVLVFGHKNPDTDTICSALAYAHLKRELGLNAEAARLGEPNLETQYALDYFDVEAPQLIEKVGDDVESVILVDHNEFPQSVDNIKDVRISEVIDHHRISSFETKEPLMFRAEPVGCTATIIYKLYNENNVKIPKNIAGLLLSAIISDSLLFQSPTCTKIDVDTAKALAEIAGVEAEKYGMDMLKAGADLSTKTVPELLTMDAKPFVMNGVNVQIAQVNTVDIDEVYVRQAEIEDEMTKTIAEKNLGLFLFVVTDIINSNSDALALGKDVDKVEKAFGVTLENNRAFLKGVVSRKKQIVTNLTDAFQA